MKYLLFDNATIAKQKSIAAKNHRWPNWYALQLAKHNERPVQCPHPDRYVEDPLHGWVEAENGTCEIEMDDSDTQHYPDDLDDIRNTAALDHAQGPK